jgi:hypothetical protein
MTMLAFVNLAGWKNPGIVWLRVVKGGMSGDRAEGEFKSAMKGTAIMEGGDIKRGGRRTECIPIRWSPLVLSNLLVTW